MIANALLYYLIVINVVTFLVYGIAIVGIDIDYETDPPPIHWSPGFRVISICCTILILTQLSQVERSHGKS